jgi:hypothetical protein
MISSEASKLEATTRRPRLLLPIVFVQHTAVKLLNPLPVGVARSQAVLVRMLDFNREVGVVTNACLSNYKNSSVWPPLCHAERVEARPSVDEGSR